MSLRSLYFVSMVTGQATLTPCTSTEPPNPHPCPGTRTFQSFSLLPTPSDLLRSLDRKSVV